MLASDVSRSGTKLHLNLQRHDLQDPKQQVNQLAESAILGMFKHRFDLFCGANSAMNIYMQYVCTNSNIAYIFVSFVC